MVKIDGLNCAAGGRQVCERGRERPASATETTPGLGSPPFNQRSVDEV
jgi:hypothetical protein